MPALTSLREKLVNIVAKVVSHGGSVAFQMAEVATPREMFAEIFADCPATSAARTSITGRAGQDVEDHNDRRAP